MCIPSIVSARVNPASISFMASSVVFTALLVHSHSSLRNIACSRLMYIIVLWMFLCPSTVLTWIMSFVLWYSIVPFQCLNVWKCMFRSLGLLSFLAVFLRRTSKFVLSPWSWLWNILSFVFCRLLSMAISLLLMGSSRELLPFSAVM